MMSSLENGKDYLIDYYALVKLPRDSSFSEITKALKVLRGKYHPDRLENVADEFKAKGQRMTRIITEALSTYFKNEESKTSYDSLLDGWTGAISSNGNPVTVLGDMSSTGLINTLSVPEDDDMLGQLLMESASFSEAQFALIENLVSEKGEDNLDPNLRAAFIEGLTEKAEFLTLKRTVLQIKLGSSSCDNFLDKPASEYVLMSGEVERTEELIALDEQRFNQKILSTSSRISHERPLRITHRSRQEREEITDSGKAMTLLTDALTPEFKKISDELMQNAKAALKFKKATL